MPRPTRVFDDPDAIHFVTNRCFQERYFLVPTPAVTAVILGCLARSVKRHKVELFGFLFMSNHFHLLVRAPRLNLNQFMSHFQGLVARQLNDAHGRTGKFFHRRYSEEPVLDDEAALERYCYIATNPCEAKLVAEPIEWPGASSHKALLTGEPMVGKWINREKLAKLRRKAKGYVNEKEAEESFEIELTPLPAHEGLDAATDVRKLEDAVQSYLDGIRAEMGVSVIPALGAEAVQAKKYSDQPAEPKRSPRPPCHCSCPERRATHLVVKRDIIAAHKRATERWRGGKRNVRFPHGTFPPGWYRPALRAA